MQNDHAQFNPNHIIFMTTFQKEDANATAIDSMLANLKVLLKKTLFLKKQFKQLSQKKQPLQQGEPNQKIASINEETKNLSLVLNKTIPPDKRMTNLFHMRIIKEIACYQKIVPSFSEILPKLQQCYTQQINSQKFSILQIYLLCERKFIQEINMVKKKAIQILNDQNNAFMNNQKNLEQSLLDKKVAFTGINSSLRQTEDNQKFSGYISGSIFNHVIKEAPAKIECPTKTNPPKCHKTIQKAIEQASKSQLYLDFKQRTHEILEKMYSVLDVQTVEIVPLFVPTLMPEDNIDFIYQKVKGRNKKSRKEIRSFQAEHALFALRREQNNRKKIRRQESKPKVDSFVEKAKLPLKILPRGSLQIQHQKLKILQSRKSSLQNVQNIKPLGIKDKARERDRNISRFRQKFEQSLEQTKQAPSVILRPNSLNPLIVKESKANLPIKPTNKKAYDESSTSSKDKQNSSLHKVKPVNKGNSLNKADKIDKKISRFGEKRGRSLKNKSDKEIVNKKLKL